jgi:hypothetical protein
VTKEGLKVVDAFIVTIMQKDADLKESVTDEELKSFFKVVDNLYKKLCSEQMNSSL